METRRIATERRLRVRYLIMWHFKHSVACHLTQVNAPRLNPSRAWDR